MIYRMRMRTIMIEEYLLNLVLKVSCLRRMEMERIRILPKDYKYQIPGKIKFRILMFFLQRRLYTIQKKKISIPTIFTNKILFTMNLIHRRMVLKSLQYLIKGSLVNPLYLLLQI
jgi:hypothetical protein